MSNYPTTIYIFFDIAFTSLPSYWQGKNSRCKFKEMVQIFVETWKHKTPSKTWLQKYRGILKSGEHNGPYDEMASKHKCDMIASDLIDQNTNKKHWPRLLLALLAGVHLELKSDTRSVHTFIMGSEPAAESFSGPLPWHCKRPAGRPAPLRWVGICCYFLFLVPGPWTPRCCRRRASVPSAQTWADPVGSGQSPWKESEPASFRHTSTGDRLRNLHSSVFPI